MPRKPASGSAKPVKAKSAKPLRKIDLRGKEKASNAYPAYRNAAAQVPDTAAQGRGANALGQAVARYVPDVSVSVNGTKYGGREKLVESIRNTTLGGIGAPKNVQAGGKVTQTGNWAYDTIMGGVKDSSSYNPQIGSKGSAARKGMMTKKATTPVKRAKTGKKP